MGEAICELCGNISPLEALEIHHIVPVEFTEPAGISRPATASLCEKCHQEVHEWYARNVSTVTYSPEAQRFGHKSLDAMAKEYEGAYRVFAQYKKGQRDRA